MTPNIDYQRVFPRDLFNEAKLLKCLGQLALLVHDNMAPESVVLQEPTMCNVFIGQNSDDGSLEAINVHCSVHGRFITLTSVYNSKSNYPLYAHWQENEYQVLTEDGAIHRDFQDLCDRIIKNWRA